MPINPWKNGGDGDYLNCWDQWWGGVLEKPTHDAEMLIFKFR